MNIEAWIALVDSIVVLVAAGILWISHSYDDGLIGRVGLIAMIASSFIILSEIVLANAEYVLLPEILLGKTGAACFLAYHCSHHFQLRGKGRRGGSETSRIIHLKKVCA